MAKTKLKITETEVSQTFDLKQILGVDVTDLPELKRAFGQAVIDHIVERTESGVDRNGSKFDSYPKSYKESDAFKAFGKTSKVNLSLTGDMLSLLDIVEDKGNSLKIGWREDVENAKAYNHNVGDTVKKRPFFGINDSDLSSISKEFKPDLSKSNNDDVILSKIDKLTSFIIESLDGKKDKR
jgi:hypothetical protein